MLPTFSKLKKPLVKWTVQIVKEESLKLAPLAAMFPRSIQHEGHNSVYTREDGTAAEMNYKLRSGELSITSEEMETLGYEQIYAKMKDLAQDLARQIEQDVFHTLDEAIKETGNTTAGPLSPESILKALDKIEFAFDQDGNPEWQRSSACELLRVTNQGKVL